jgi:hypothetical protein
MFPGWRSPVKPGTDPRCSTWNTAAWAGRWQQDAPTAPEAGQDHPARGSPCALQRTVLSSTGVISSCRRARAQREGDVRPASGSGAGLRPHGTDTSTEGLRGPAWAGSWSLVTGSTLSPAGCASPYGSFLQRRNDGRTVEPSPAAFGAGATFRCVLGGGRASSTRPDGGDRHAHLHPGLRRPVARGYGRLLLHPGPWVVTLRGVPNAVDHLPRAVHAWPHHLCGTMSPESPTPAGRG